MFINKRKVGNKSYFYLDYSLAFNSLKKRYSLFIGTDLNTDNVLKAFDKLLQKVVVDRTKYVFETYKTNLKETEVYRLEEMRTKLAFLKDLLPNTYKSYDEDEFISYAQGTSSVEGNKINLTEAKEILEKGVSISSHSLRDIKEIENIGKLRIYLENKKTITERILLKMHSILMQGFNEVMPGKYRQEPIFITASEVIPLEESKIKDEMKKFFTYYEKNKTKTYALDLAGELHVWFEYIHPFLDGNGRVGREFMNFILQKNNFPRVIVNLENRFSYIKTLETLQLNKKYKKFGHYLFLQLDKQFKRQDAFFEKAKKAMVNRLIASRK